RGRVGNSRLGQCGHLSSSLHGPVCRQGICLARLPEEDAANSDAGKRDCQETAETADAGGCMKQAKRQVFTNVWDAIADSPAEAANLELRYQLMEKISEIVRLNGWTQTEAAKRCGVTQPRLNDLLRGRISRFSIDALVNIASALGRKVRVRLDNAA